MGKTVFFGNVRTKVRPNQKSKRRNYVKSLHAAFGVIAIIISFLLLLEDKRKGYGLQKPNVK